MTRRRCRNTELSSTYRAVLQPAIADRTKVRVVPRGQLKSPRCQAAFRPTATRKSPLRSISSLEGSSFECHVAINRPVAGLAVVGPWNRGDGRVVAAATASIHVERDRGNRTRHVAFAENAGRQRCELTVMCSAAVAGAPELHGHHARPELLRIHANAIDTLPGRRVRHRVR